MTRPGGASREHVFYPLVFSTQAKHGPCAAVKINFLIMRPKAWDTVKATARTRSAPGLVGVNLLSCVLCSVPLIPSRPRAWNLRGFTDQNTSMEQRLSPRNKSMGHVLTVVLDNKLIRTNNWGQDKGWASGLIYYHGWTERVLEGTRGCFCLI